MKRHILSICIMVAICACSYPLGKDMALQAELDSVCEYMAQRPDSALCVLRSLEGSAVSPYGKARMSLLHSMALDKCYIDLQTDSIINPALHYFSRKGSPDERLKMYYYKARIFENCGDWDSAMSSLLEGEKFANDCLDNEAAGRLFSLKAAEYSRNLAFDDAVSNLDKAIEYYSVTNYRTGIETAMLDKALCCVKTYREGEANIILDSLSRCFNTMNDLRTQRYYDIRILSSMMKGNLDAAYSYCNEALSSIPSPGIVLPGCIWVYNAVNKPDSALALTKQYRESPAFRPDENYYLTLSQTYAGLGRYQEAYEAQRKYSVMASEKAVSDSKSDLAFLEERHYRELEILKIKQKRTVLAILLLILFSASFAVVIRLLKSIRLKDFEKEEALSLLKEADEEKEMLSGLLSGLRSKENSYYLLLSHRLDQLNKALVKAKQHKASSSIDILREIANDKTEFLCTLAFFSSASNPKMYHYLVQRNMTEEEIGYCSLYLMGMNGKDIFGLLDSKAPYRASTSIRAKLGLSGSDTNLYLYLNRLKKDLEK